MGGTKEMWSNSRRRMSRSPKNWDPQPLSWAPSERRQRDSKGSTTGCYRRFKNWRINLVKPPSKIKNKSEQSRLRGVIVWVTARSGVPTVNILQIPIVPHENLELCAFLFLHHTPNSPCYLN